MFYSSQRHFGEDEKARRVYCRTRARDAGQSAIPGDGSLMCQSSARLAIRRFVTWLIVIISGGHAEAALIYRADSGTEPALIVVSGEIQAGDGEKFVEEILRIGSAVVLL